jgi:nucleotide-binding universal stress UspA family protein
MRACQRGTCDALTAGMNVITRRYRIVVAVDESEYSEIVLEHAFDQALRHNAVDLHFLTVVESERDTATGGQRLARQLQDGFPDAQATDGDRRIRLHVRAGNIVDEIIRLTEELDADLLIVGRFAMHSRHRSLAPAIVERAPCPTLVIGLTEHAVEATPQCPACAEIRAATDAEIWFCDEHRGDPRVHTSSLLPWSSALMHARVW